MHCDPFLEEQIPLMLDALGSLRDRALFALGVSCGLRVSELLQIRRRDLIDEGGALRERVTVYHTKGEKVRTVAINALARPWLSAWLRRQEGMGIVSGGAPVFTGRHGKAVGRKQVWAMIRKAARRAGLSPAYGGAFGTHSMRKTFGRAVYVYWQVRAREEEGIEPLMKARDALGHEDVSSTQHYLRFMTGRTDEGVFSLYKGLRGE